VKMMVNDLNNLVLLGIKYKKVCTCIKQPCMICFCLYTLYIKQIEEILDQ